MHLRMEHLLFELCLRAPYGAYRGTHKGGADNGGANNRGAYNRCLEPNVEYELSQWTGAKA